MSIFAKWFYTKEKEKKPTHKVCLECKVHYEPTQFYYLNADKFSDYCNKCREPKVALYNRKQVVTQWAERNWQKLEKRALADNAKLAKKAQEAGLHDAARMFALRQSTSLRSSSSLFGCQASGIYRYHPGRYEWY